MTRLFLIYQYAGAVIAGWAIVDAFFEEHAQKILWQRFGLALVWPLALLFKRTRNLLLLGGL